VRVVVVEMMDVVVSVENVQERLSVLMESVGLMRVLARWTAVAIQERWSTSPRRSIPGTRRSVETILRAQAVKAGPLGM